MNKIELEHRLKAHLEWLKSNEESAAQPAGNQLVLEGEHLSTLELTGSNFSVAKLSGCKFVECRLETCNFSNAELMAGKFENCRFIGCQFVKADLRGLTAEGCDFSGSDFTGADLTDAVLTRSVLRDCVLDWSWLVRTDLRFADLSGVHMENARLLRTKLYNEKQFRFALPSKITIQEIDVSPSGDASSLTGKDGLERLLELSTA